MKLTQLMNEGEEKRPLSNEVKKHFLEIVSTYNKYQESLDRKSDIQEIAETLGGITEAARTLAIHEGDDWFDKHTIKRNMSELEKLGKEFDKCAVEAKSLDQRLGGLYEDMGNILSRYYKMGDITEEQMKERLGMNESKSDCGCGCGGVTEGGCSTTVNEGKFKVDDLVYNKRTKTVGIVRIGDDKYGEVKTDADGNVDVDELEKYNPIKFKHQSKAKAAPSTQKEVSKRGLFNPFKNESVNEEKPGLWANIRAKQARGEKPAHKNSQAHKDAVKAGKKINKEESVVSEAKFGYKDSTASYINNHKDEYKQAEKLNKGNEVKFYDTLSQMEDKIGHPKFMIFLSNALRGYKVDMYKDPKIKNPQDAQEALYLLSK